MDNTVNQIEKHIVKRGRDKLYLVDDFLRYGDDGAVRVALSRLVKKEMLIRVAQGIYAYPKIDTELGLGIIYPSMDRIARLIAKRDKARIVPTGAYALHVLGLSTQVPTNIVYHTDGAPRKINVYNHTILFKHTVPKNLAYKSEVVMLVVSAMKEIGNGRVTESELEIIAQALKSESAEVVELDLQLAPAWIRKTLIKS
ncbi:MAG: DUF6088 family protein [Rikenellaceae bacterium]